MSFDYMKLLKSRTTRLKLLRFFSFIPDKQMLQLQYRIKMHRKLNLRNPRRYTEKLQWYKLNYRNKDMIRCVDKYDVRTYISEHGYESLLTHCFGVYENVSDINFSELPKSFVIKDTLAGGGNSVIIVKDKEELDLEQIKKTLTSWLNRSRKKGGGREWPYYSGKKHRILIEEYIASKSPLVDYKFFCFSGKVACLYVIGNRNLGEHGELAIMDREFHRLPVQSKTQATMVQTPDKPIGYNEMVSIAENLGTAFPHVRVDLYNVEGKIYFGELTFFGASGYQRYDPDSFDYEIGDKFVLR